MTEHAGDIRVAIVGVGNCASSLVQGVQYYQDADENATVPGLMHVRFGPYHVRDVKFVAAFDVDAKKVGFDLSEAIFASENNTIKIADVPPTDVVVQRGPTLDGIGKYYADTIEVSDAEAVDVVKALRDAGVDVLVSYLWAPKRPTSSTPSAASTPAWRSSTRFPCSSRQTPCGPRSSKTPASRSSVTTSRARSARPSPTV